MSKYDITGHDITTRINNHKWSVEKALTTPKGRKNVTFKYKGKDLTVKQLYNIRVNKNITYDQLRSRLLHHNWNVERAITQLKKKINQKFLLNDKEYTSHELADISPFDNMTYHDITDRIRSGWTVEQAVYTPKRNY